MYLWGLSNYLHWEVCTDRAVRDWLRASFSVELAFVAVVVVVVGGGGGGSGGGFSSRSFSWSSSSIGCFVFVQLNKPRGHCSDLGGCTVFVINSAVWSLVQTCRVYSPTPLTARSSSGHPFVIPEELAKLSFGDFCCTSGLVSHCDPPPPPPHTHTHTHTHPEVMQQCGTARQRLGLPGHKKRKRELRPLVEFNVTPKGRQLRPSADFDKGNESCGP